MCCSLPLGDLNFNWGQLIQVCIGLATLYLAWATVKLAKSTTKQTEISMSSGKPIFVDVEARFITEIIKGTHFIGYEISFSIETFAAELKRIIIGEIIDGVAGGKNYFSADFIEGTTLQESNQVSYNRELIPGRRYTFRSHNNTGPNKLDIRIAYATSSGQLRKRRYLAFPGNNPIERYKQVSFSGDKLVQGWGQELEEWPF